MRSHRPADSASLARAVADAVVLKADDGAQAANPYYWHRAQDQLAAVLGEITAYGDADLSAATAGLLADPRSVAAWQRVCDLVAALDDGPGGKTEGIALAAWDVVAKSRLGYHVGDEYDPGTPADEGWRSWPAAVPTRTSYAEPLAHIVIPFRDRTEHAVRARNLAACLASLGDQTQDRSLYRVTVVESDDAPRWQELIELHADEYLFARKPDSFSKCWSVNAGVVNTSRPAPLVCILDADALVDADFVRRNTDRFLREGTGALLPFRNLFYLDAPASARAIADRCSARLPDADPRGLRGFLVHRAPGVCMWLRRDVFDAVGGMDERFEGWGREDIDFVLRVQLATAFDIYDDRMLHLHHPSSAQLDNGHTVNAHIPLLSWVPDGPIGRLDRYRDR
ncbi:glycosyltransferase [Actinocrinis puniceicyclus]|uniref:Glycosyltransferase n=1 Tax=Actinocrinis puniceicyclus TaxID=977794 RepID=A0A8J8BDZ8_9ACTN|nr:galactosyltransferase-related protein [Actinocrinis puniceicyclus]MBS2966757.1 glycosyltransferase [Actinocrinis puniceicyclus]